MGNLTSAANGVSRIRRTYNKNGAIATETDSLRTYTNATSFGPGGHNGPGGPR
jgi:hypothetical protein